MVTASWKSDDDGVAWRQPQPELSGPDVGPTWTNYIEGKIIYIQTGESKSLLVLVTTRFQGFRTDLQQQMLDTNTNEMDEKSVGSIHDT